MPAFEVTLGDDAVEFAAESGLILDPWQRRVLHGSMGLKQGGKWSARQVGLLVPRQNGKGSVLEARELYAMFVGDERLIIHSAHRYDTSQDHFRRILELIEGNPDLAPHIKQVSKIQGKESILLKSGTQLKFKARTLSGSGRGFSCDLLVLDEAFLLPEQALAAMLPTLSARPNPQTWFTSSSGYPESAALWRVVTRGRNAAAGLAYWEWGVGEGFDISDRSLWRSVNPGRASMESLEDDFGIMTAEDFAREHLGAWDDAAEDQIIPKGIWDACADRSGARPQGQVAFAIHSRFDRSATAITVSGQLPDGHALVEVVESRPGVTWAVSRLKELTDTYPTYGVVIDPRSAVASLIPDLEQAFVPLIPMTTHDVAQAFGMFHDAAFENTVRHTAQPELSDALAGATRRLIGEAWTWDGKGETDIKSLVAATNALWGWTTRHGGELQIF